MTNILAVSFLTTWANKLILLCYFIIFQSVESLYSGKTS